MAQVVFKDVNLLFKEEKSPRGQPAMRSIKIPSRISDAGCGYEIVRQFHVCARLLEEKKGGDARIVMKSTIASLDIIRRHKGTRSEKLDIYK